ncbi:MAG: KEOPS complex subunit Pcc1 [Candidatus Thermoplasmatota archaeon]
MKKAEIKITFDNEDDAKLIADSIQPEIEQRIPKTNVEAKTIQKKFFITIKAEDLSSLRAACNSYLKWIKTAYQVEKIKK